MIGINKLRESRIQFFVLIIGLLVLSIAGTTAILMVTALKSQNRTLTESTLQSNFEGARNINVSMNTLIDMMFHDMGATAQFIMDNSPMPEHQSDYANAMLGGRRIFNSVIVADENGIVRSSTPDFPGITGQRIAQAAALREQKQRNPYVSEPFIAPNGHSVVLFAQPMLNKEGQFRGYIGGLIDFEERNIFSDIFDHAIRSKKGTYAYVVNPSGRLMLSPDKKRTGEVIEASELERKLLEGSQQFALVTNAGGVPYLAGYLPIPRLGWGVVFQSPAAAVDEAMNVLIRAQLESMIPLFGLILVISLWVAKKLTSPFAALTVAARQISAGERISAPPFTSHWNYEAHHLAKAMMRAIRNLQHQADQMTEQAQTDSLTGLANRSFLEKQLEDWMVRNVPYSLLVLDIDHFKEVNDVYGHQTGDEALIYLSQTLVSEMHNDSLCCRYGGEEFVVLLPKRSMDVGLELAERIRRKMAETVSPTGKPITVSIGMANFPEHGVDFEQVFERADQALYHAKRTGRNQTISADEVPLQSM